MSPGPIPRGWRLVACCLGDRGEAVCAELFGVSQKAQRGRCIRHGEKDDAISMTLEKKNTFFLMFLAQNVPEIGIFLQNEAKS